MNEFFSALLESLRIIPGIRTIVSLIRELYQNFKKHHIKLEDFSIYIKSFLNTNRCPSWDPELCSLDRIKNSKIHYIPVESKDPPAFTGNLESFSKAGVSVKLEPLTRFIKRMQRWKSGYYGTRKNVFVLLGDPGNGKSSLVVQIVTYLAIRYQSDSTSPVPVYVNLAHFDKNYTPNKQGLTELVRRSIEQACPRYIVYNSKKVNGPLSKASGKILSGTNQEIMFVFDGMDEMSTDNFNERVRAIADFMNDGSRRNFLFLLTCRYIDFVKLADFTQNLYIQRLDLLPWTKKMVEDFVNQTIKGNNNRKKELLETIFAYSENLQSSFSLYHPLLVTLISLGIGKGKIADHRLSTLWNHFILQQIKKHVSETDQAAGKIIEDLSKIAYNEVWPSSEPLGISQDVISIGIRAGLLRKAASGVTFEIRPLLHHLAAKELLRRIRKQGRLPDGVFLEDLNVREVFKSASEQAQRDDKWLEAVLEVLKSSPADLRTHGDRLAVVAYCLTNTQVESNQRLQITVHRLIEYLVTKGDEVEKERCFYALEQSPWLLDPDLPNLQIFFKWIVECGSENILNWLIRLLAKHARLRRHYRRIWFKALWKSFNNGSLGKLLHKIILLKLPRKVSIQLQRIVDLSIFVIRSTFLFVGHYFTYVMAWSAAIALAAPISRLFPDGIQFNFFKLWTQQFDFSDIGFQLDRLRMMLITLYIPRYYILKQARAGIRFQKWWQRYLTLLVAIFGIRFSMALFAIMLTNIIIFQQILQWLILSSLAYVMICLIIRIIRNPRRWRQEIIEIFKWKNEKPTVLGTGVPANPDAKSPTGGVTPIVNPSDLIIASTPHNPKVESKNTNIINRFLAILGSGVWVTIVILGFVMWGINGAIVLLGLSLIGVVFFVIIVHPILELQFTRRRIRENIRKGLMNDLEKTFNGILEIIRDTSYPEWIRALYIDTLTEIRFTKNLYDDLNQFYSGLPSGNLKNKLAHVVALAYHEIKKET